MLKENSFFNRLKLLGGCFFLLMPCLLMACGAEAPTSIAIQITPAPKLTTGSSSTVGKPGNSQARTSVQSTNGISTPSNNTATKPASSAAGGKAPKSGEDTCALVTKEEASTALGLVLDHTLPGSSTGFSCDYYAAEQL